MSAMEFVLVALAILIGMGIAEILRGFADLIRAQSVDLDPRHLVFATWVLLILLQFFWAMWRVQQKDSWTFPEFLLFLLPAILMYVIGRVSFPKEMDGTDLGRYYDRVCPALWGLTAALYVSFGALQPLLYDSYQPLLLASQVTLAVLALAAVRVRAHSFHLATLAAMVAQLAWRGFIVVVS